MLEIINEIRVVKGLTPISVMNPAMTLRDDLNLTSFDLAELTVKLEDEFDIDIFEDGLVSTLGEVFNKLNRV